MRHRSAVALLCVIAAATPTRSLGQWRPDPPVAALRAQVGPSSPPSVAGPTLLSLALPGAGQHVLGQRRKWLYLTLEVAGWAFWAERRAAAGDYRDRYRDFAWERGRIHTGARVEGDFEFYERMTKWSSSGAYDADPQGPGVQPEPDPATYNGYVWTLATGIYLPPGPPPPQTDPAYQSALAYYGQRAYGNEFLWDWSSRDDQEELARLIKASDDRFGQATTIVGAVIANHLLSATDAYLSSRGRAGTRLRLYPAYSYGRSPAGRPAPGWLLVLTLGVGR